MHADADNGEIAAKAFTFREMAVATKNFRQECVLFDDGFGRVFKGTLKSTGQVYETHNTRTTCTWIFDFNKFFSSEELEYLILIQ